MDFCIASYVKALKKYSLNRNMSNEEFVNALFATVIDSANVKDRNNNSLYLDKARVSKLLARKENVPSAIQAALAVYGIEDKITEAFTAFLEDTIDCDSLDTIITELANLNLDKTTLASTKENSKTVLVKVFIEAIKAPNLISTIECLELWEKGKNSVVAMPGDIFKFGFDNRSKTTKNIVVIPVNTAFDTHITTQLENDGIPLVSQTTIHGQWLNRIIKSGETEDDLYNRISQNLKQRGYVPVDTAKTNNGRVECYPIGSVAVIDTDKTVFYLLAVSAFDKHNNAQSGENEISTAIEKLLETYDLNGQGYPLYLPLLGTGRSRAGLSYQASFDLLKEVIIKNETHIQGRITIVIEPDVFKTIKAQEKK